ncbi:hypothetical protein LNP25_19250 [Klebsiella variicola subsp. variicola]|nr:hypothetical protein [Klebsiella variicola subsp. variicola]
MSGLAAAMQESVSHRSMAAALHPQNAVEPLRQLEINGLFIGRAAWDAQAATATRVERVSPQEFILQAQ